MGRSLRSLPPILRAALLAALFTAAVQGCLVGLGDQSGLWRNDGLDYAQIGREIAEGRGFSSRQAIYALHLRFLDDHGLLDEPWPNLHRFPLPSLTLAGLFLLFGANFFSVLLQGVLAHAATSAVLHAWALQAAGRWPARAVTLLFTVNAEAYFVAQTGLAEPVGGLFGTLGLYGLWRSLRRTGSGSRPRALLGFGAAGLCLGLSILSRSNAVSLLPVALLIALVAGRRRSWLVRLLGAALLLAGCLGALAPWAVRNAALTGSPSFALHGYYLLPSGSVPGETKRDLSLPWVRDFVEPRDYLRANPEAVGRKWLRNAADLIRSYPTFGSTFLLPLLIWLGLGPLGGRLRPVACAVSLGFLANGLLCCLTDYNPDRYYFFLLPTLLLVATVVIWGLLGRALGALRVSERSRRHRLRALALVLASLVTAGLPSLGWAVGKMKFRAATKVPLEQMDYLRRNTAADAVIVSNDSALVAWHTKRRSIRSHYKTLPDGRRVLALLDLDDLYGPLDGLYLSGGHVRAPRHRRMVRESLAAPEFQRRFQCEKTFSDGAVFCRRRPVAELSGIGGVEEEVGGHDEVEDEAQLRVAGGDEGETSMR